MNSHSLTGIEKQRLVDMAWLLNDICLDLKTPTDIIYLARDTSLTQIQIMSIGRMALCALFVNISKLLEALNFYGKEIRTLPPPLFKRLIDIKREIEEKGIYEYRSTYIAHAFLKEKDKDPRPLMLEEASNALKKIINKGLSPPIENAFVFCSWVYTRQDENCVVKTIEQTVKEIELRLGGLSKRP